jgi:hypothetical protein
MKFIKIDPFLSWDRRKVANTDFFFIFASSRERENVFDENTD